MSARQAERRPTIERRAYRQPAWLVDQVEMTLALDRDETRVSTRLEVRRNPDAADSNMPMVLNGSGLETVSVAVDGRVLNSDDYTIDGETLSLAINADRAVVETVVLVHPAKNTALEGLYAAGEMLLTQCEAEGFRKITWYPDRPDIMATSA